MITSSWSFSSSSSASSPPVGLSAYYPFPPKDTITHVFTKACHVSTFTFTLQIYFDILRHIKRLFKKKRNSVRSWAFVGEQEMELFFTIHGKKPSKQYAIYVSFLSSSVTLVPDKFVWTASAGVDTTLKGSGNDVFSREFLSGLFMAIQRAFFSFSLLFLEMSKLTPQKWEMLNLPANAALKWRRYRFALGPTIHRFRRGRKWIHSQTYGHRRRRFRLLF